MFDVQRHFAKHTGAKTNCLNLARRERRMRGRREKNSVKEKKSDRKHLSRQC